MTVPNVSRCCLCASSSSEPYHADARRPYLYCPQCHLVFVPASHHLSLKAEKSEYLKHENHPQDLGYRRFLNRVCAPLLSRIRPNSTGLDFGCGPGPTLSVMLEEHGHQVALYDPFFSPDPGVLQNGYDFITATEVVEHLRTPRQSLDLLWDCLHPGGWLALQTKRVRDIQSFKTWHYIQDPTHIAFFDARTFEWLATKWGTQASFVDHDVVFFRKPAYPSPTKTS